MIKMLHKFFTISFLFFLTLFCMGGEKKLRIVSLSPAITEIICHLGGEEFLVGRSSSCNYPEKIKKLPVAGNFAQPDLERCLRLRPRYILSNDLINPSSAKRLRSYGIQCVTKQSASKEEYFFWVRFIGGILNKKQEAEKEITRVETLLSGLAKGKKHEKILWVIWDAPIMLAGKNSLPDYAIKYAGGKNAAGHIRKDYFKASGEWILKTDPDWIIFAGLSPRKQKELGKRYPWNSLRAWKKGRIITELQEDLILRPGPRFFQETALLNRKLQQEKFSEK